MGWWKISSPEEGGIDWDFAGVGPGSLINAIPGSDHTEIYYNGDGPADIMDRLIREVREYWPDITHEEFKNAFLNRWTLNKRPYWCTNLEEFLEFINKSKKLITQEYKQAWERDPYPEEWQGIASFCTSVWR